MVSLDLASRNNKQRIIDTFVNSIYVYDDKAVINFNCREESETIPLKLSTYVSDLRGLGEPIVCLTQLVKPNAGFISSVKRT